MHKPQGKIIGMAGHPAYKEEQRAENVRYSRIAERLARDHKSIANFTPQINPEWQD